MEIMSAEFIKGIRGTDPIACGGTTQIAFVGRSNVGKSSIISSIARNKKLVKVSDVPGKTREINFFLINKAPSSSFSQKEKSLKEFYLVDLPGYGYSQVGPEEKEKLRKLIIWYITDPEIRPKMIVLVLDVRAGMTEFDLQMLALLKEYGHHFCIVANKMDKLTQRELALQMGKIHEVAGDVEVIPVSAIKPGGLKKLIKQLSV